MHLEITDLELRYAGAARVALKGLSLSLQSGDIGVLIGPSGCGKTTVLRALAGLEPVQQGTIRLGGEVVSSAQVHVAPEQRRVGLVFQDFALFPHLSVHDNVAFGLHSWPANQRAQRVAQMLDLVGMAARAQRLPHQLSGGQQQRVALARALAPEPRMLLLDEPFSNLDIELRERLAQELRAILKAAGVTALFVTHDQLEAFALADRIGVLQQGQLHQWDDAYTLYHRPATRFVADFIGQGVFVPATVRQQPGSEPQVLTPLGDLRDTHECPLPSAYPNGECDLLLRADDIVHDDQAPVQAEIVRKTFRGAEFLYTLRLDSGHVVLAHVPSHHNHAVGERIGIRAEVDHVVTFARA